MFERFTERARQVVVLAQDEARLLNHGCIGEEHLLLGLLREEDGVAARVLRESGVELESTRRHVRAVVGEGEGPTAGQIPFTPRAKAALERALRESLSLGSSYIGTEHVLLGLLREPGDVLGKVLENAGSDIGTIVSRAVHGPGRPAAVPPEFPKWSESERFTERARRAVALAQDEARTLTHNYVGTEHLLLGLLREEEGLAARVLDALHVTIEEVRAQVTRVVGVGDEVMTGQIPFTPRAKKVLELALREALSLGHNYIGTEHILLGLVRENEGVAARVLLDFDADAERIRNDIIRMLPRPGRQMQAVVHAEHPVRLAIPCPSCGATIEAVVIQPQPGSGFAARRHGPGRCTHCGAEYDIDYSIELRPT